MAGGVHYGFVLWKWEVWIGIVPLVDTHTLWRKLPSLSLSGPSGENRETISVVWVSAI